MKFPVGFAAATRVYPFGSSRALADTAAGNPVGHVRTCTLKCIRVKGPPPLATIARDFYRNIFTPTTYMFGAYYFRNLRFSVERKLPRRFALMPEVDDLYYAPLLNEIS